MKGSPISIRFDKENLSLAKTKSGIKSAQKIVDFLLSEYVDEVKSKPPTFQKSSKKTIRTAGEFQASSGSKIKYTESKPRSEPPQPSSTKPVEPVDKKWAAGRIKELEDELKSPPKNPIIGLTIWKRVREQELEKLKNAIK